jgi:hypothetical protein
MAPPSMTMRTTCSPWRSDVGAYITRRRLKMRRPSLPLCVSPDVPRLSDGESRMKKQIRRVSLVAALLILSACGQPVPDDKAAYVGEWRAQTMSLLLTRDGTVRYKRNKAGVTTSIDGPLRRFEGDNFVVGIPFISSTFEVSKPPYQEAWTWKMVVDGVELTRVP